MKKSTHTGTCQACGRAQALPAGVLAKHGLLLSGMHRAATEIVCGYCNGSGWEPLVRESSSGQQGERCPQCNGVGRRWV